MAATVQDILNSVQDSTAASQRCAGSLWKLALSDPDETYEDLRQCIDYLVSLGQKFPHVERCIRFFGMFASKAPPENEVAAAFLEELLQQLASHLSAVDKTIRYRSCQLLQHLLSGLPDHVFLDESVAATLRQQLAERLQDRLVAVRTEAVRCICHLIDDSQEGQAVLEAVVELLETDRSKDVRTAALESLPLHVSTLPVLLECMQDDNSLVRRAVIQRLHSISITLLSIKQRAEVIQHVLLDKESTVAEAGAELLAHWLQQDCQGDPLKILQLLDVETYTEAAALLVESLLKTDSIKSPTAGAAITAGRTSANKGVISYVETAISSCGGGDVGGLVGLCELNRLLEPQEALMWRCLCEWLRNDAISKGLAAAATGGARAAVQAAVAAERHEVLERALPESADQLLQLIMQHTAAGPAARFAATQLLMIATTCVEWVDAASRNMAAPVLRQLVSLDPTAIAEQVDADLSDADSDGDGDLMPVPAGMQLAGNGGDGHFEAAVVQLVLAVQGAGAGFTVAMLDGIAQIAAGAGLLAEAGSADKELDVTVSTGGDGSCMLQCLAYIRLLLQQLPCGRPVQDDGSSLSFERLWGILLVLALKQEQPVIRAKAVECIALYAMATACNAGVLTSAIQVLAPLAVAGGCSTTRKAALQGLTDIAMLVGPAAVDAVLVASGAAVPISADAATNADGDVSSGNNAGAAIISRGLLELLIGQAEVLLAEAQAPVGKLKRGSRGAVKSEEAYVLTSSSAELLCAVGESLAKLLLHQRTWLRRYMHCAHRTAPLDGRPDSLSTPAQASSIAAAGTVSFPPDSQQHQALLLVKALALLLQLLFHPATVSAVQLRQCLAVFFEVFAAAAMEYRLQLVAACLPAARQALHLNSKQNSAVLLVKSVTELLQHQHTPKQQQLAAGCFVLMVDGQVATFEALAVQLLHEVNTMAAVTLTQGIQPTKYKPYLSSLLKLVCEIPLQPCPSDLEALQALGNLLCTKITDVTVKKDIKSVLQLLEKIAHDLGADQQQLDPEQLDGLIERLEALSLQLPALPDAIAAVGSNAAATPAPRTARKPATAKTGGRGAGKTPAVRGPAARQRASASSSDAESDSSDSDSGDTSDDQDSNTSPDAQPEGTAAAEELSRAAAVLAVSVSKAATDDAKSASRPAAKQPLGPSSLINA